MCYGQNWSWGNWFHFRRHAVASVYPIKRKRHEVEPALCLLGTPRDRLNDLAKNRSTRCESVSQEPTLHHSCCSGSSEGIEENSIACDQQLVHAAGRRKREKKKRKRKQPPVAAVTSTGHRGTLRPDLLCERKLHWLFSSNTLTLFLSLILLLLLFHGLLHLLRSFELLQLLDK